jgi:4-amino-4-deoxy-L-arabinose transferase-like glycosyltransferase
MLAFYLALERRDRRRFYLAAFAIASALAVMTKGVQGLIFFAPLAAYVIALPRIRGLMKTPSLYLAFLLPVAAGCLFYFLRERAMPGYVAAVLHVDIGRYTEGVDANPNDNPLYYLLQPRNLPWLPVLPFALWLAWRYGRPSEKTLTGFLATGYFGYLLIISFARTKQGWYALPLHPLCALMIGVGFSAGIRRHGATMRRWGGVAGVATVACAATALLVIGLDWVLVTRYYPSLVAEPQDRYSYFLRQLPQLMPDQRRIVVLHPGYPNSAGFAFYVAPARFYVTALNDRGYDIALRPLHGAHPFRDDGVVLACDDDDVSSATRRSVTVAEAYGCTARTNRSGEAP